MNITNFNYWRLQLRQYLVEFIQKQVQADLWHVLTLPTYNPDH